MSGFQPTRDDLQISTARRTHHEIQDLNCSFRDRRHLFRLAAPDSFSSISNLARPRPPTHTDTMRHSLETTSAALSIAGEMEKLNRLTQRYSSFTPEIALAGGYELSAMIDALSHLKSAFRLLNLRNQPLCAH